MLVASCNNTKIWYIIIGGAAAVDTSNSVFEISWVKQGRTVQLCKMKRLTIDHVHVPHTNLSVEY